MNLFEINLGIEDAFTRAVDPETGEIIDADAFEALDDLQMAFDEKAENIACWIKNLDAEAKALKEQKQAFSERQARTEKKADSLKRYLAAALNGEKKTYTRASIGFRKSQTLVIEDEAGFIQYAQNGHDEWLKFKEPEINKTAVKDAIKAGQEVRFARVEDHQNIQIK